MSRNLSLYLADILSSIDNIQSYTRSMTYDELIEDGRTLDAVIHNFYIIGEATKQIPETIRIKYPQVEWKKIAGLRDIIAHAYFSLNTQIIWSIIQTKLEPLKAAVEAILENEERE